MWFAHLNQHQRYQIEKQLAEGKSAAVIARSLGIHRSTVYRELRRGQQKGRYCADTSHQRTLRRRKKSAANHRHYPRELWQWVRGQLKQEWSPQQISGRLYKRSQARISLRVTRLSADPHPAAFFWHMPPQAASDLVVRTSPPYENHSSLQFLHVMEKLQG